MGNRGDGLILQNYLGFLSTWISTITTAATTTTTTTATTTTTTTTAAE